MDRKEACIVVLIGIRTCPTFRRVIEIDCRVHYIPQDSNLDHPQQVNRNNCRGMECLYYLDNMRLYLDPNIT